MTTNKRLATLIIVIVVLVGVVSFLGTQKNNTPVPTQTTDQTVNWKIYTSPYSKFSIKLPENWFAHETKEVWGYDTVISYPVDNPSPQNSREGQKISMIISVSQSEGKTLFEQAEKLISQPYSPWNKDYKIINQNYVILTGKNGNSLMIMTRYQTSTYNISVSGDVEKNRLTIDQILSTFKIIDPTTGTDTSNWTVYTNKTYGFSIKFPRNYEVQPGNEEQNTCIRLSGDNPCEVLINIYPNKDNLSLEDYLSKESIAFSINGPLISYNFNGYDTLFNKNQPGTNLFIKRGLTVLRFVASKASSDKEVRDIVATFKFTQ